MFLLSYPTNRNSLILGSVCYLPLSNWYFCSLWVTYSYYRYLHISYKKGAVDIYH